MFVRTTGLEQNKRLRQRKGRGGDREIERDESKEGQRERNRKSERSRVGETEQERLREARNERERERELCSLQHARPEWKHVSSPLPSSSPASPVQTRRSS